MPMNRFHIALDYAAGADPAPVSMWVIVVDQWIAVSQMSSATPIHADADCECHVHILDGSVKSIRVVSVIVRSSSYGL